MFEFQQFIAFIIGLTIMTMGFWLMIFLISFVLYWATGGAIDLMKENKANVPWLNMFFPFFNNIRFIVPKCNFSI